jgi:hypothetical protein
LENQKDEESKDIKQTYHAIDLDEHFSKKENNEAQVEVPPK